MGEPLPQLYDVTYTDADDSVISVERFRRVYDPEEMPIEREMRFREVGEGLGAADYTTRLMRSNEVRKLVRAVKRDEFWREVTAPMVKALSVDDVTRTMRIMQTAKILEAN